MCLGSIQHLTEMSTRHLPEGKRRSVVRMTTSQRSGRLSRKYGSHDVSRLYGSPQLVTEIALPKYIFRRMWNVVHFSAHVECCTLIHACEMYTFMRMWNVVHFLTHLECCTLIQSCEMYTFTLMWNVVQFRKVEYCTPIRAC
jgi:hypothetical protein